MIPEAELSTPAHSSPGQSFDIDLLFATESDATRNFSVRKRLGHPANHPDIEHGRRSQNAREDKRSRIAKCIINQGLF